MKLKYLTCGAEAEVYSGKLLGRNVVVKRRIEKPYRAPELDAELRKNRTRLEASLLWKAKHVGIKCPSVLHLGNFEIIMCEIEGKLLKDSKIGKIARKVGEELALLHSANIVHGDFTPANIIINKGSITIIDFGLGNFSHDAEDKAIDVLLMKKSISPEEFGEFLKGYEKSKDAKSVLAQMKEVEKRGRYVVRAMTN